MIAGLSNLTSHDAMVVEQVMIEAMGGARSSGGSLLNHINAISPLRVNYESLRREGWAIVSHAYRTAPDRGIARLGALLQ